MFSIKKELIRKAAVFGGGVLFGTAGVKILGSSDAKKFYTNVVAGVLRAKECTMDTVTKVQENADDILAEANAINAQRKAEQAEFDQEIEETEE